MEGEVTNRDNDVVAIELPAPKGWKKRFTPKKGGTPKRNEIIFISPTGEEIKTKKQLDQYVKSHPEGPSASEFDWGTGDTPRRSARLSEKPKAEETPETDTPKKKQRRSSSSKKEAKGKKEEDDVQATEETKETAAEETKETTVVATDGGEVVAKETPAEDEEDKAKEDAKQKTHEGGGVTEKVVDEKNIEKEENVATDAMEEDNTENKSVPTIVVEENNKEAEKESTEPEAPLTVTRKEEEVVKDVATPALEIGEEDQKKVAGENAEAVPPKPAGGGGEYQSGNYEPKTSQVSC